MTWVERDSQIIGATYVGCIRRSENLVYGNIQPSQEMYVLRRRPERNCCLATYAGNLTSLYFVLWIYSRKDRPITSPEQWHPAPMKTRLLARALPPTLHSISRRSFVGAKGGAVLDSTSSDTQLLANIPDNPGVVSGHSDLQRAIHLLIRR